MLRIITRILPLLVSTLVPAIGLSPSAGPAPQLSIQPDLVVKWTGQDGLLVYPGYPLSNDFKLTLSNEGGADAADFDVDVILSQNRSLDGKTHLLARLHVPRLKGRSSVLLPISKGFKIPADAPARKLYIIALADSGQSVRESIETNNAASLSVIVQMRITSAYQVAEIPQVEFYIKGIGFGPVWGSHEIRFDGTPINVTNHHPSTWSDSQIYIQAEGIACRRDYALSIAVNGAPVSNVVKIHIYAVFGYLSPPQGPAGTAINIKGNGFGAAQGSRILKLGNIPVPMISSWSDTSIDCRIPSGLAPGTYRFSLWEGGNLISLPDSNWPFKVL